MRVIIILGILIALAVIGVTYTGDTEESLDDQVKLPQNKSLTIFNAIKNKGIDVENAYTTNGSEIKEAFGLEDSIIRDDETIAFIIFRYSKEEGVDKKIESTIHSIYTTFQVEPSIEGVLVMPYDTSTLSLGVGPNLIYANSSYAKEVAFQGLTLRKTYNKFEIYTILSEIDES